MPSGGKVEMPDFLKHAPELWLGRDAHGSIRVQERQPSEAARRAKI
jgi:hypothetical protein